MSDYELITKETKEFTLTIRAVSTGKGWPPVNDRLKGLLKAMLRSYGFRVVALRGN